MDGRSRSFCSSSSSCHSGGRTCYQANQDRISFLLGQSLPSCYPSSAGAGYEFGGVGSSGTDHCSLLHSRRRSPDPDLDSLDCEIEDGAEVSEEPATMAPARSSSSKRNRAAEVHNLSEKRRRSKINEKMKALQSLIPNSSKTDKASMLDEAIEYLKQLQLQVQMLSIRNSLSQHPMYLSGALQPLQALQMGIDVGLAADRAMNLGVGMLPLNQGSSVVNSFDLSSLHQFASMPSVINITTPGTSFAMEPSHPHHGSILLPMTIEEILTREMIPCQQPDARHSPRRLTENEVTSMAAATSQHFRGQASSVGADHAEECMLGRVSSQDLLSKLPEKETFVQSLRQ